MHLTIKQRILIAIIGAIVISVTAFLMLVAIQKGRINSKVAANLDEFSHSHLQQIVNDVYSTFDIANQLMEATLENRLNFGKYYLNEKGGIRLDNATITWEAINQETKEQTRVTLPRMLVGGVWLGQVEKFSSRAPVVDELKNIVGGDWTIFQRMNEQGDMLRVATNVKNAAGNRGIGTYIPAVGASGTANPIIKTVLAGDEYIGAARVVDVYYPRTVYYPLRDRQGKVIGMLFVGAGSDIQSEIKRVIGEIKVGKSGYVYVLGGKQVVHRGHYIISQRNQRNGENIYDTQDADGKYFIREIVEKATNSSSGQIHWIRYPWKNPTDPVAKMKVVAYTYYEPWDWIIGAGMQEEEFYESKWYVNRALRQLIIWSSIAGLGIVVVLGFVGFRYAARIMRPIDTVTTLTRDIAQGEGDLTKRIKYDNQDEIGQLVYWFNLFIEKIQNLVKQVIVSIQQVSKASEQLSSASEQMASGSEEQQSQLSEIATSMEEMSAMILEASRNANETQNNANEANRAASEGNQIVQDTIHGIENVANITTQTAGLIQTLEQKSLEIDKVIQVIQDIADQTNLLALNANIEAARAGEAGRGFAVVADEVRKLAERTVRATDEIGEQIKSIQTAVRGSVEAMNQVASRSKEGQAVAAKANQALEKITQLINNVNAAIIQIATSSDEQSSGAEEISKNIETISTVAKEMANSAQNLAALSEELNREIKSLEQFVGQFKV